MIDVGFGGDCPLAPLQLVDSADGVRNLGDQRARLKLHGSPQGTGPDAPLWVYQTQEGPSMSWKSQFSFTEIEFGPRDLEVMSFYTSTSPNVYLTRTVVALQYEREGHDIKRKIILRGAEVTSQTNIVGHDKQRLHTLKSEAERVQILASVFDLCLTPEEADGIRGKVTELKQVD